MKAYEDISCKEMIEVIKEALDVSNVQENRREYVVAVSVCGFQLWIRIYKENPKDWRITGFNPVGEGLDEMLMAAHAINDELDRHYY